MSQPSLPALVAEDISPLLNQPPLSAHKKRVALVLGSGGARGYAHIGVIEELEARGYEIIGVAGCSMGALIGGIYAAGKLKEYKDWVTQLNYFDLFKLIDFTWSPLGAIKGEKIMRTLSQLLGDINIEDLPLPFTSVATDLLNQKEVWFQEGPLEQAIRASIAVPGVITPVEFEGRTLVDGGLLNPLPLNQAAAWHADFIVAVNVTAAGKATSLENLMPKQPPSSAHQANNQQLNAWVNRVGKRANQLLGKLKPWQKANKEAPSQGKASDTNWGKLNIILQSFDITQGALAQYKIAGYPPDVLIEVPRSVCSGYEFHRANELIALGQQLAKKQLDKWEASHPWLAGDLDG